MSKSASHIAKLTAASLAASMLLMGCGEAAQAPAAEEEIKVLVNTMSITTGDLVLTNSFIGKISPEDTVDVIPKTSGTVTETFFEVGQYVEEGDVLFKIDDEAYQLQAQSARIQVEQSELQSEASLTTGQNATDLQLESSRIQAQSGYENAQIAYVSAKDSYNAAKDAKKEAEAGYNAAKEAYEKNYKKLMAAGMTISANELQKNYSAASNAYSAASSAYTAAQNGFYSAQSGLKTAENSIQLTEDTIALQQGEMREQSEAQIEKGLELARVGVDSAELSISYCTVTAPVSGYIEAKNVDVNGMASPQMPAYTIVNNNSMTVTFHVSEKMKDALELGQKISLDRNNKKYEATISEIGSSVDAATGLFKIKGNVSVSGKELANGVSVKIDATTQKALDAIIIPYDCCYYDNNGAYVYVNDKGVARKNYVTTGIYDGENMEIISGLAVGDEIVITWSPQLTNGVLLDVAEAE